MNWMTSAEAAAYTRRHRRTVQEAAAAGQLHGSQQTAPHGTWLFRRECLDAWIAGESCEHQTNVRELRAS